MHTVAKFRLCDCHWLTCSWIGRVSEVVPKRRGLCECRHRRLVPLGSSRCSQSRCIHHMSLRGTRYAVKQDFDILSNRCSFAIIFKSQTCVLTRTSCKCTKMFRLPETSMYPVYRKSSPNGCRVRGFTLFRSSVWNGHDVSTHLVFLATCTCMSTLWKQHVSNSSLKSLIKFLSLPLWCWARHPAQNCSLSMVSTVETRYSAKCFWAQLSQLMYMHTTTTLKHKHVHDM